MGETNWTRKELHFLKSNWMRMSGSEIGKVLNRTRQSVIGKANRLGLKKAQQQIRQKSRVLDVVSPTDNPNHFANIKSGHCLYMKGTDSICCGEKAIKNKAYCVEHYKLCHVKTRGVNTFAGETSGDKISIKYFNEHG